MPGFKAILKSLAWVSVLPVFAVLLLLRLLLPRRPVAVPASIDRLTLVAPYEPSGKSGGSTAIANLIETLERGYRVAVVPLWSLSPPRRWRAIVARYLLDSVPIPRPCGPFLLSPGSVRSRLDATAPVVIEFVSGSLFTYFGGAPPNHTILRDHEVLLRRVLSEHAMRGRRSRILHLPRIAATYLFTYRIYLGVDQVVALTPEDGADLVRFFPRLAGRVRVIPVSFEVPNSLPAVAARAPGHEILFLANFYHRPNVDGLRWFLREVAPQLRPGLTLHLCGMDEPLDKVDLPTTGLRVTRHGFVPDVAATFSHVTVAVSPLISGGGVRMKNLFLAAQRKAIVTTPLGNQGIDFEPGRSAEVCATGTEMARTIERLLDDPDSASEIANAGYEHVKRQFTAGAVLDRYRELVFAS